MINFLTKKQVAELTGCTTKYKCQVRALRDMGIDHRVRPDGRPMVLESDVLINKEPTKKTKKVTLNLSAI